MPEQYELVCTHKGLLLGVVPVYAEDDDNPGMVIRHWSFALPAGVVYGVWTLYAWIMGKEAGIPVRITGELDEPIRYRFEED